MVDLATPCQQNKIIFLQPLSADVLNQSLFPFFLMHLTNSAKNPPFLLFTFLVGASPGQITSWCINTLTYEVFLTEFPEKAE